MDTGASSYHRFLEGDKNGIVEIIRDYKDGLILYIYRITGNFSLSEEIAEDTFFRIYTRKPKFSGKSSFKTWLYTIGRNRALNFMRYKKHFTDTALDECTGISDAADLETDYIRKHQSAEVRRAMQKLRSDYRQVLYLVFFEEFSNEDTAKIMHKSKRQVEMLIYRGKQALRKQLEKEGFHYEEL